MWHRCLVLLTRGVMNMREILTTAMEICGGVLVCVGVGLVFVPAGIVFAGVGLILTGWLVSR